MAEDVERTEPPTPRRRREAALEGRIAISHDAFVFANLLAVTLALLWLGSGFVDRALSMIQDIWRPPPEFDAAVAVGMLRRAFGAAAAPMLSVLLASATTMIAIGLLQTRGSIATKRMQPKLGKLDPAKALGRLFKRQGPAELLKSIAKVAIVGGMLAYVASRHLEGFQALAQLTPWQAARFQLGVVIEAFLWGCVALLVLAALDYAWQHRQTEKALRMTRQEVQDELRQMQGDPHVKVRLRSLQYQRARTRMMQEVPKADVVVTNPQHLSIALRYERASMRAPTVVAKGAGILAQRIREIARQHGVPLVENPPLARTLYRGTQVGETVPEDLFQAVAELLAFVYRLDPRRPRAW
jgi:flagellar biosynthetic protein FlhB